MTEKMSLELKNQCLDEGYEVKGHIPREAQKFAIWIGSDEDNVLQFTCYWDDPKYGTSVVFTTSWDPGFKEIEPNPMKRDTDVTIPLKDDFFKRKLSDKKFSSPNTDCCVFQYFKIMGDVVLKSLKV